MKNDLLPFAALFGSVLCPLAVHAAQATGYADVVSATPVTISLSVPRQVCRNEQQIVQPAPTGAGAVIGAIAGAVIGHNIGGGFGRAAATGLGVVAGSVIGDQIEANNTPAAEVSLRRCQMVNRVESRVVGYDVMYDHAGQRYSTRMARDPGARLAIEMRPAGVGNDMLPVPAEAGIDVPIDVQTQWSQAAPVPASDSTPGAPPQVVYYDAPQALFVAPPLIYLSPFFGFGFGYYGGYYGGYGGHHRGHGRWR